MSRKMVTIDGNQACTHVAYATSEVITIYPITPSSPMAAEADAKANAKQENIWGSIPVISQMQSEAGVAGSIRLGTITTSGAMLLPELIGAFHRRFPQVTFQLWEGEGARILELLDNRVIEIGITRTQVDQNIYDSFVLPNEPLIMVMHRTRCVCGRRDDEVRLSELKEQPLIIPLRWKTLFVTQCKKLGFEPQIVCVSDSIVQDVLWTKMGIGMSLLPLSARSMLTDEVLVYKKLTEPEISTHTVVAWLKNRTLSSSSRHLLAMFKEMFLQAHK